ncbi:Uncharacterized membrane protein [Haloechinothrix alba]|uniref:Uncharacterized membrane protein n=1 Tax=Haloechinothrix alba TaxID=664784 RepID=A0A238XX43_9PSEU|nr:vitamin K epoxide reductase family protein [Haloechinothrix alba]SNR63282.1 Uncharacterized membrane protein [Haloechinothrix alba]
MTVPAITSSARERGGPGIHALGWLYLVAGAAGFVASATLMIERVASLRAPEYVVSCSINPVVACGSVMDSPQAEAFGFPNPLLGIAGFAVVVTSGVGLLAAFRPPRWYWLGMLAGSMFGLLFVHWLIYHSLYTIEALCPYCMVVWAVTVPIFWYTLLRVLRNELWLPAPVAWLVDRVARLHTFVLTLWFLGIAALIVWVFWDYWSTLL